MRDEREDAGRATPVVEVSGLTVRAGARTLVRDASLAVGAGEVVLVVGPSGAGKSILLRILAGLVDAATPSLEVSGTGAVAGAAIIVPGAARRVAGRAGIVFQEFALFDEWSAEDNLRFAADHARLRAPDPRAAVRALAEEFHVPMEGPLARRSRGQRQRLAVARTLAFGPEVLLYDEPTSGLDPANAARVAERIRATARAHGRASVVVTHDYPALAPVADRILMLDPSTGALTGTAPGDLEARARAFASRDEETGAPRRGALGTLAAAVSSGAALPEMALALLFYLPPLWRRARWGLRFFLHYFGLVASPSAFLYIGTAGAIAGFVATYFTFEYFPYRAYTEPLLLDDVLGSLGFLLYRILVPVLATVLVAARCGAAVAADVGNRSWSGGLEAIRSFGVDPGRYLLTGILWAFLLGVPLMTFAAFVVSELASLLAFSWHHPERSPLFWDLHFHRFLAGDAGALPYVGSGWLLAKVLACAAVVALVSWRRGRTEKTSVVDVNRAITGTVIAATLGVLLVHFLFAFVEF